MAVEVDVKNVTQQQQQQQQYRRTRVSVLASVAVTASAAAAVKSVETVTGAPEKGVALTATEAVSTSDWMELSSAELVEAEALWYSMSSGEAMEVATRGKEESSMAVEASLAPDEAFKGNNSGEEGDSPGGGVSLRSSVPLLPMRS